MSNDNTCKCPHAAVGAHEVSCPLFPGSRNDERSEMARDPFLKAFSDTLAGRGTPETPTALRVDDGLDWVKCHPEHPPPAHVKHLLLRRKPAEYRTIGDTVSEDLFRKFVVASQINPAEYFVGDNTLASLWSVLCRRYTHYAAFSGPEES